MRIAKMIQIEFPSHSFSKDFDHEVAKESDFIIQIVAEESVRQAVRRQIGSLITLEASTLGLTKDALEKFRLREPIGCFAHAVNDHRYKVSILEGEDLKLLFKRS
jgi:hypothetical protein